MEEIIIIPDPEQWSGLKGNVSLKLRGHGFRVTGLEGDRLRVDLPKTREEELLDYISSVGWKQE